METLTNVELIEIHGGDWDWGDFARGVGLGLGVAGATLALGIATGGVSLAVEGAALAWCGVGLNALTLVLGN